MSAANVLRDPATNGLPAKQGLYDPENESDACGVGFVVNVKANPSHKIVSDAKALLCNMVHRGATGSDSRDGDGAGIMTGIPSVADYHALPGPPARSEPPHTDAVRSRYDFMVKEAERELNIKLPRAGEYATGNVFFKKDDPELLASHRATFEQIAESLNLRVLGWREVPTDGSILGPAALSREPLILQPMVVLATSYGSGPLPNVQTEKSDDSTSDDAAFDETTFDEQYFQRQLYVLRKHSTHTLLLSSGFYICSLSNKTIVYKGQLSPVQVYQYYHDLSVAFLTPSRFVAPFVRR